MKYIIIILLTFFSVFRMEVSSKEIAMGYTNTQNIDLENAESYFFLTKKIRERVEIKYEQLFFRLDLNSKKGTKKLSFKDLEFLFEPIRKDTNIIQCIIELNSKYFWTKIKYNPENDIEDIGGDIRYFKDIETNQRELDDFCFMLKRSIGEANLNGEVIKNIFKVNQKECIDIDKEVVIYLSGKKSEFAKTYKKNTKL